MTPTPTFSLNDANSRAKQFTRVSTATIVTVAVPLGERWIIYAIQDTDGATNTYRIDFTPAGAGNATFAVFRQATASNVPVGCSNMPSMTSADTVSIVGTVAANYLVMYQAVPL